jgi:hypothetical protein
MCTLTYLPYQKDGYLLTTNRDEAPQRAAHRFVRQRIQNQEVLFPQDTGAGGTWIAMSDSGLTTCLINGAFERHRRMPPYRRSRGLMLLDLYKLGSVKNFLNEYSFAGIEPCTLIAIQSEKILEIRWDGDQLHLQKLDPRRFHIWSSPVLYGPDYQKKRERWFAAWLETRKSWTQDAVLHFHLTAGEGNAHNDLVMDRNGKVCTVSITSVKKQSDQLSCLHLDLLRGGKREMHPLPIRENITPLPIPVAGKPVIERLSA